MFKFISGLIIGISIGSLIGAIYFSVPVKERLDTCADELMICEESLNDPHSCVSIVVEMMEGTDETNRIK